MGTQMIHHLGLAVKDLTATTAFFTDVLNFTIVADKPDYPAKFISNGHSFLTLWQTESNALPFNRRTAVGLHHFALTVESEVDLERVFASAQDYPGVTIDFAPEPLGESGAVHAMLFEPGGIRLELIWPGK